MKKTAFIITLVLSTSIVLISCDSKRQPGKIYMPDMTYSRAYETYAPRDSAVFTDDKADIGHKIFYNNMPPAGTIKRNEMFPYTVANDSAGYAKSAEVKNPLPTLNGAELEETGRLFNVNCGVCHGEKGLADGPIAGKIGAVANLTSTVYVAMADGTMFYSMTYGKNNMGSYASQLDSRQRWMLVHYIRTLQGPAGAAASAATDSTAKK